MSLFHASYRLGAGYTETILE